MRLQTGYRRYNATARELRDLGFQILVFGSVIFRHDITKNAVGKFINLSAKPLASVDSCSHRFCACLPTHLFLSSDFAEWLQCRLNHVNPRDFLEFSGRQSDIFETFEESIKISSVRLLFKNAALTNIYVILPCQ